MESGSNSRQSPFQSSLPRHSPPLRSPTAAGNDEHRRRQLPRPGKKKRQRRKSFAASILKDPLSDEHAGTVLDGPEDDGLYPLPDVNDSSSSIDSEVLLDHRDQKSTRPRRSSTMAQSSAFQSSFPSQTTNRSRRASPEMLIDSFIDDAAGESAALLSNSVRLRRTGSGFQAPSYGSVDYRRPHSPRKESSQSSRSRPPNLVAAESYNINYPPSVPGTPTLGPTDRLDMSFGDAMMRDEFSRVPGSPRRRSSFDGFSPDDRERKPSDDKHDSISVDPEAEADVCFPVAGMSDMGEDDLAMRLRRSRRRRRGQWPDLSVLEEWSRLEERHGERHPKRVTEPQLINGRLRHIQKGWYHAEEEKPYRFTYFNEEFSSTVHCQTISGLAQDSSFRELFIPERRLLSDDEDEGDGHDEDDDDDDEDSPDAMRASTVKQGLIGKEHDILLATRPSSSMTARYHPGQRTPGTLSPSGGKQTPTPPIAVPSAGPSQPEQSQGRGETQHGKQKNVRYGDRPVWWLDVLCPTEAEMRVLSKAFGIHPLTAEDIMVQEAREKVELFQNYYFVNYRTFDQDINSATYLDPVDMYVVVFREGVLSFHFEATPHPANVRRRVRQLKDYMIVSSDWISYAIIDDITDVFVPLIQNIEEEVDEIDDAILRMHSGVKRSKESHDDEKASSTSSVFDSDGDMLRSVGDCRKRVMGLFRLLGNKADVIKGFAKRCNERWEVAPRSEIGLYLGDIQDHIVTMTSNLSHYEKMLARSHANYLAQLNIRSAQRQEKTADVLGRLTVMGTIFLPMSFVTGLWGMNVWVPGQQFEGDLKWFFVITAGLLAFGMSCFWFAKTVYGIV